MNRPTWREDETVEVRFDETKTYRYLLACSWEQGEGTVTFVMLNPSIGDEERCNPTMKRCVDFARDWGYRSMQVVNLFSYISVKPTGLLEVDDPVGAENDAHIVEAAAGSDLVVFAWGAKYGDISGRDREVARLLAEYPLHCIGKTKQGHPRHPLYLKKDLKPIVFN
ncbi:DUF1643 domain-containing protein [Planococcus lenghuensis]|uniref:DUF1643 domain-containing protein n=1 Tax=Planococcus lenghuensis TaxID=2213202 RepID=A0A1Q2KVG0_9BACL|nr:DUF1643 domain-containing protein [Planococcus lenghuensis]AQQ52180.1 hypothetical protein B0X71_03000 [Planococcus lenghuensis]